MENLVLVIGGIIKSFTLSDAIVVIAGIGMILLLVYFVYLVRLDDDKVKKEVIEEKKPEEKTLTEIVNEIKVNYTPQSIDLSEYEKEQEDSAIISYDELVKRANNNIYYEDEYDSGATDVLIQKVNNEKSNTQELVGLPHAIMMSYEDEEEFLSALKVLQKNLVR